MRKAFSHALRLGLLLLAIHSVDAAPLYWNDNNEIHRAALDGSGAQNVAPTFASQGIAVNPAAGLFWTDDVPRAPIGPTGTIRHAGLDGSGVTDVLPGLPTPIGIATRSDILDRFGQCDSPRESGRNQRRKLD
jgi:hypothetical protein